MMLTTWHFSCQNIDKIFKYNHRQTNILKNIDDTASDAHCIKRYKLTVILALQIA